MNRLNRIYQILLDEFGEQGWWPIGGVHSPEFKHREKTPSERFEIAVGAILTQNTSWNNVEKALAALRKKDAFSPSAITKMPLPTLSKLIKSSGYHNQKAKKLKLLAKYTDRPTREGLLSIWGIGPETADSILLYAHNEPIFPIDAFTRRILSRIGLCEGNATYAGLQEMFHTALKPDPVLFNEYHALLVRLTKSHCKAKPCCDGCPLSGMCNPLTSGAQ